MTTKAVAEDTRLITGNGRYVSDLCDSDTLHCWFVRSPVSHGLITEIDISSAVDVDGVVAVYTADDLDLPEIPGNTGRGPEATEMRRSPLARDRVRYSGEAVAVVVARSPAEAEDGAGLVWVVVEDLPAITTIDQALEDRTLLFAEKGTNLVMSKGPDPDTDIEPGPVSVTTESVSQRLAPTSIEPPALLARPDDGEITVWCGHQAPHRLRSHLSRFGRLDDSDIRVITPDVGGAFGMKGMLFPEYLVVARIAYLLKQPVAWICTRRENIIAGTHGRSQRHRVTLHASEEGVISAAEFDIDCDVGAYPHNGSQIPLFTGFVSPGLYDIPRVAVTTRIVVTNLAPLGSYRGAGRPEAALAIERAMDVLARETGVDPVELRLRNMIQPSALPFRTPTGALYDSGDYPAALRRAAELLDLPEARCEQRRRFEAGENPIGVGIGAFIERAGGAIESGEYAKVEIDPNSRTVVVRTGTTDQGQGQERVWRQIATTVLDIDEIDVRAGDTADVSAGVGTYASRSTQIGGSAIQRTADRVLAKARRRAASHIEAAEEDLIYEEGVFSVVGSPGSKVSIFDLAKSEPLEDEEMYVPGAQTFPYGVHSAVVEVSLETGEVHILRIVAVDDCGTVMNEALIHGQLVGSLTQGLGQARLEALRYDEGGQLLTSSLMDYLIPTANDVPPVISDRLVHPAPSNPLGAKGAGEAGCIGLPPAILNATLDALASYGVTDLQLPLQQDVVWAALQRVRKMAVGS